MSNMICPNCGKEKKRGPYCKECRATYNAKRREQTWINLGSYKQMCSCKDCGIKDPRVLVFYPSDKVMAGVVNGLSWSKVFNLAIRTDVICVNCSTIRNSEGG